MTHSLNPLLFGILPCFSPCCNILNVAGVYKKIVDLTLVKKLWISLEMPPKHVKSCDREPAGLALLTKWTAFGNGEEKSTEYAVSQLPAQLSLGEWWIRDRKLVLQLCLGGRLQPTGLKHISDRHLLRSRCSKGGYISNEDICSNNFSSGTVNFPSYFWMLISGRQIRPER